MKRLLILIVAMAACVAAWAAEPYVVYTPDNTTLTFYYGTKPSGAYGLNDGQSSTEWDDISPYVTRVVFDPSFAQARPTSTAYWFSEMYKLTTIIGIDYLNTSEVEYMSYMFSNCKKLTNLDLRGFNTSKVTIFQLMFNYCTNLTSLDLSSFNTSKTLTMFKMFYGCSNLTTIFVSNNWTTQALFPSYSSDVFTDCTKLVGGAGTTYDPNHVDFNYAHIDGGPSNPGYLTSATSITYDLWVNGVQVTGANCDNLSSIDGVSGTVTYNPSSKTLTLENARLSCGETSNGACIRSSIDGLTINVTGTSSILIMPSSTNMNGMVLSNTTITGTDTLGVQGRKSGITIVSGKTLTVNNLHCLIARGSYGIYASSPTNTRLVMKGSGTNVIATGGSGAIRNMGELVLEDGLRITEPVGGYFAGGILYDASGNVATRATISGMLGDVNGDGTVTAADSTALYDVLLNNDYSHVVNGDQTGDNIITAADVTAVYTILLSN